MKIQFYTLMGLVLWVDSHNFDENTKKQLIQQGKDNHRLNALGDKVYILKVPESILHQRAQYVQPS